MAYAKSLDRDCQNCDRKARFQVFNCRNESMGYFCHKCGTAKVDMLCEQEEVKSG